jgi:hypothetical protein
MTPIEKNTKAILTSIIITLIITTVFYVIATPLHTVDENLETIINLITKLFDSIPTILIFLLGTATTITIITSPQIIMLLKPFNLPTTSEKAETKSILIWTAYATGISLFIVAIGLLDEIRLSNSLIEATNNFAVDYKNLITGIFSLNLFATCLHCTLTPNWRTTPLKGNCVENITQEEQGKNTEHQTNFKGDIL